MSTGSTGAPWDKAIDARLMGKAFAAQVEALVAVLSVTAWRMR